MLNIGESPVDFTLNRYNGGSETLSAHSGKIILLSFVEYDDGWNWLHKLVEIQNDSSISAISANVQIIAVVFEHNGSINQFLLTNKINNDSNLSTMAFPLLSDNTWASSLALDYQNGFSSGVDSNFSGNTGTANWTYIISKDHLVSDKSHLNTSGNGDPISFNRMTTPADVFNSADLDNTKDHVIQRILNLNSDPVILSSSPVENSYWGAAPANVEVVFSKPIDETAAETITNYTLSGSGISAGSVSGADYSGVNKIENVVELSFTGLTLNDSVGVEDAANITVNNTNITDTDSTALTGDNVLNYIVDTVSPVPVLSLDSGFTEPVNGTSFDVEVDFGETVNDFTPSPAELIGYITTSNVTSVIKSPATDAQVYTFTITPSVTSGSIGIQVPASVTSDAAGHNNVISNLLSVVYDNAVPIPDFSLPSGVTEPLSGDSFEVEIDFGEVVNDFSYSSITVPSRNANITGKSPNVSAQVFTITVTPSVTEGTIQIQVPEGMTSDSSGNECIASSILSVDYDNEAPTPVLSLASGLTEPVSSDSFEVEIDFGEDVSNFSAGLSFITTDNVSTVTKTPNADAQVYTLTITPSVISGTIGIRVPESVTSDSAGHNSLISNLLNVVYDNEVITPVLSLPTGVTEPVSGDSFEVDIDFGEVVNDFVSSLITITSENASITAKIPNTASQTYTITITPSVSAGTIGIQVPAAITENSETVSNNQSNVLSVEYNRTVTIIMPRILSIVKNPHAS